MTFKYAICYPDKEEIEQRISPISGREVLNIARSYPWIDQLKLAESLNRENFHYNPSLEFTNRTHNNSFTLTAHFDSNKNLEFSLWFNRIKKAKGPIGPTGTSEKMTVDDIWNINFETALKYLDRFINEDYEAIESLFD